MQEIVTIPIIFYQKKIPLIKSKGYNYLDNKN